MDEDQTRIQVARLEERMQSMHRDMVEQAVQMKILQGQLAEVLGALREAKGGWRTLMWIGGAASAGGGAIAWAISHLTFK